MWRFNICPAWVFLYIEDILKTAVLAKNTVAWRLHEKKYNHKSRVCVSINVQQREYTLKYFIVIVFSGWILIMLFRLKHDEKRLHGLYFYNYVYMYTVSP